MLIPDTIFRAYDIRGVMGDTLSPEIAYLVGRSFGHVVSDSQGNSIVVGRDGRLSSPLLSEHLIKGLCDAGIDVIDLGVVPTPVVYFSDYALNASASVMVTGSHNPPDHNGFKMTLKQKPFFDADIQKLRHIMAQSIEEGSSGSGLLHVRDMSNDYIRNMLDDIKIHKDLCVVWDPGNGATGNIIEALVPYLPGQHYVINGTIDGTFPNHHPDPANPKNLVQLQDAVATYGADLGIAFDGDGDRCGVVDNQGHVWAGDQLTLPLAQSILVDHPNAQIIADVKTSQAIFDALESGGAQTIMWKTGHSHIKSKMKSSDALFAGEMSGHYFFKDRKNFGYDDGIYAALRFLEFLSHQKKTAADLFHALPKTFSTPEMHIPCADDKKFDVMERIRDKLLSDPQADINTIDGVRVHSDKGWWLLRPSNTQAVIVGRCEAASLHDLEALKSEMVANLHSQGLSL